MTMAPAAEVAGLWLATGAVGTALARLPIRAHWRGALAIVLAAPPLAAPFLLAGQAGWVRFLVAVQSALCAFRMFDLAARGCEGGAGLIARARRLIADLIYVVIWPSLDRTLSFRRFEGPRSHYVKARASRAALFGLVGGLLMALGARLELPERYPATHEFAGACEFYLLGIAFNDTVLGLFALAGFWVEGLFDYPIPPRSLLDFWGRNDLQFHHWLKHYLFRPFARRRRPVLGVLAVFVASGIGHEYLMLACAPALLGRQFAFFFLNGVGCVVEDRLVRSHRRRTGQEFPFVLRSALVLAFLVATSPLMFSCLDYLLHFHGALGEWLLGVLLTPLPSI